MATLENSCSACYKASAPECCDYYLIGGLTPGTEYHVIATDSKSRAYEIDDNEAPVDINGNLKIIFPEGVNTVNHGTVTIQIFLTSDIIAHRNFCSPQSITACDGESESFSCIELSFFKSSPETPEYWEIVCTCDEELVCDEMCGSDIQGILWGSCPPITGYYNSISEAPDGTVAGQLVVVRYIEDGGVEHIHLYSWNGGSWDLVADTSAKLTDGFFDKYLVEVIVSPWEVSIDSGATWDNTVTSIFFTPPVTSITVWFRNTENGCVYTNLPLLPLSLAEDGGNAPDFEGYWLSPNSKVIYLYDNGVIISAAECCSGIANYYPDMALGPMQWNETDGEWQPMIEYTPSQFYPGTSIVISANVPEGSTSYFQTSLDGGSTWGSFATAYSKTDLETLVEIPITTMSYRSRLAVTLANGCTYYSAQNTLSE